jgi:hypothetical protein
MKSKSGRTESKWRKLFMRTRQEEDEVQRRWSKRRQEDGAKRKNGNFGLERSNPS